MISFVVMWLAMAGGPSPQVCYVMFAHEPWSSKCNVAGAKVWTHPMKLNGITYLHPNPTTKIVDAYCEGDCHGIDPPYTWPMSGQPPQATKPVFWHMTAQSFSESAESANRRPYIQFFMDKPHVIEIRTKRIPNGWTRVCWYITYGDSRPCEEIKTPKYCPPGATCEDLQDTHKTLWIDNVKIGTIREVEEK